MGTVQRYLQRWYSDPMSSGRIIPGTLSVFSNGGMFFYLFQDNDPQNYIICKWWPSDDINWSSGYSEISSGVGMIVGGEEVLLT